MIFEALTLPDAMIIKPEPHRDERGFFARTFCREEFARQGLSFEPVQQSLSYNALKGTLRGLHYQLAPHQEQKLVRCTRGRIFDVIVDLRKRSEHFGRWAGLELSAENRHTLYIPAGFAHGFITLEDDTELQYEMDVAFDAASARTLHWNSPELAIAWPLEPAVISQKDALAESALDRIQAWESE